MGKGGEFCGVEVPLTLELLLLRWRLHGLQEVLD